MTPLAPVQVKVKARLKDKHVWGREAHDLGNEATFFLWG